MGIRSRVGRAARGRLLQCGTDAGGRPREPCVESRDAARETPLGSTLTAARAWTAAAAALAVLAVAHALFSAAHEGWTYDEAFHLQWSERFLDTGVGERASQERFNSKTPIMVPAVLARKAGRAAGAADPAVDRFFARAPSAFWLAALLLLVGAAARAWGPAAAALAVGGVALDPNLAAHASLATADVPYAFATLASLLAGHRFWTRPSSGRAALLGAALGLAFVAKVSAVLLLPGLAVLPLVARRAERPSASRLAALLLLSVATAWTVVCTAYLGHELARPLGTLDLRSTPFRRAAAALPGLRLPLPAAFVTAFDASFASERREWNVVLLGRLHTRGVWYYFAVLWALKTPLLLLAAQAWGLARAAARREHRGDPWIRLLALNLALTLAYFSLLFHAQIGYRYVLMAVPMAWLIAAAGLSSLSARRLGIAAAVVAAGSLAEDAAFLGNPLAFTNAAVQPKRLAYRLLADSNIDWGQNRERLPAWLAEREWGAAKVEPVHLLPGRNVLDLNALAGVFDFEQHRWAREHLEPRGHLGHTWLWYDVDGETFNRLLYDTRRPPLDPGTAAVCPDSLDYTLRPGETEAPLSLRRMPQPDETWIACVAVRKDTDVGFRVTQGAADAGVFLGGECQDRPVAEGQEAWWRLDPGVHALCAVVQPYRRTFLPYQLDAAWRVRGPSARIAVRPLTPAPTPPPPEATSPRSSSPRRPPAG